MAMSIKSFFYRKYPELASASEAYHAMRDLRRASFRKTPFGFSMAGLSIMQEGAYEPEQTDFIVRALQKRDVFIDVGANVGYYSCIARHMGRYVVAIEPLLRNLQFLYANMDVNGWNDVEIFPLALSYKPGMTELYGTNTAASLIKDWAGISTKKRLVPLSTMDILVGKRFEGSRVVVKVDVEGSEYSVLQGSKQLLSQDPAPLWIVEVVLKGFFPGGFNPDFKGVFDVFFDNGYTCRVVDKETTVITEEMLQRWITGKDKMPWNYFVFEKE